MLCTIVNVTDCVGTNNRLNSMLKPNFACPRPYMDSNCCCTCLLDKKTTEVVNTQQEKWNVATMALRRPFDAVKVCLNFVPEFGSVAGSAGHNIFAGHTVQVLLD